MTAVGVEVSEHILRIIFCQLKMLLAHIWQFLSTLLWTIPRTLSSFSQPRYFYDKHEQDLGQNYCHLWDPLRYLCIYMFFYHYQSQFPRPSSELWGQRGILIGPTRQQLQACGWEEYRKLYFDLIWDILYVYQSIFCTCSFPAYKHDVLASDRQSPQTCVEKLSWMDPYYQPVLQNQFIIFGFSFQPCLFIYACYIHHILLAT